MEFFHKAKVVRLRSHHEKYLLAHENEEFVTQDRNGSAETAKWTVESVPGSSNLIRLKSVHGKYLTASNIPFLLGISGRKVTLSNPSGLDSSHAWEPIREGSLVKLKTHDDHYLRGNGGLPPWRNSVTTDVPHRISVTNDIFWHVDILETLTDQAHQSLPPLHRSNSLNFKLGSSSSRFNPFFRQSSSSSSRFPRKNEGRMIYYQVTNKYGEVEDDSLNSLVFNGNDIEELSARLKEEINTEDVIVCKRSPINGELFPLHLNLPPGNAEMTVFLVPKSSKSEFGFNFCPKMK